MEFSLTFIQLFFWGIYLASPLLLMLCSVFLLLGLIVGHLESWKKFDSLYWAFITAFTVGLMLSVFFVVSQFFRFYCSRSPFP